MKNNPDGETIEVFAVCYNEEVMLPHFIKHYQEMGAAITIFDNMSTDRSKEIILDAGIFYRSYDSNNQIRDDLYLQIKNNCWKSSPAAWAIVCDIDELLEIPFSIKNYTIINTKGFDMIGMPGTRTGVPNRMYSKHVMFRPDQFQEIGYKPGCHTCAPKGRIVGSSELANLLHYKYTSEDYVFQRHLMYQERLSDLNKQYGWGIEYQNVEREKIAQKFKELNQNAIPVPEVPNLINFK